MERQAGLLEVLKYRDFRLMWIGQFISITGSQMRIVAVDWQVYQIATAQGHNPALALGLIGLMRVIPMTLSALFAGVAADRFERRKVIMVTSIIALLASVILAIAGSLATPALWLVYAMVIVTAIAGPSRNGIAGHECWYFVVANGNSHRTITRWHPNCHFWGGTVVLV
ncbi:MAG: hypothetical protein DWI30_08340 [Chloroflexi bacterium]|nr:MAG: hypothetical protein DWI30_08340 [Chloroflexota bacterium]